LIIGKGDIASVLHDRMDCIFFASGVSNSQCTDEKEYDREKHLLKTLYGSKWTIFYFSTIAVNFLDSRYTRHKIEMEELIKENFQYYNIIRVGNITWGVNPHTFINYLRNKATYGEIATIRDEWKYLISKEQLLLITDNLPLKGKNEISIFGTMKKVKDCI